MVRLSSFTLHTPGVRIKQKKSPAQLPVITSYSIHYTKLYDADLKRQPEYSVSIYGAAGRRLALRPAAAAERRAGRARLPFVMWDIISRDFDRRLKPEQVCQNVLRNVRPGSVIIFHDSLKAEKNMKQALPMVIRGLRDEGFSVGDPHLLLEGN